MASVIRLLLAGDVSVAGQWAGYAKKLAGLCIRDNIPKKVVNVDGSTTITVTVANNDAKVTIQANGERYYQFANTTPLPTLLTNPELGSNFLLASAVAVKLPPITSPGAVPDWSKAKVFPTGSTIEGDENSPWPRLEATPVNHGKIMWVRNIDMVTYIPEPVYVGVDSRTGRTQSRMVYSWSSREGQVRMAGALSPLPAFVSGDVGYDASPSRLIGARVAPWQAPDADWPHDACLVTVDGGDAGKRLFIVLADAFGEFHCWPVGSPKDYDLINSKPQYATQSYRANIPPANAKTVLPPYPGWVKRPAKKFRDHGTYPQSTDPRNVVRFHPHGTKAVVMAVERRPVNWSVHHQKNRTAETSFPAKIADLLVLGGDPSHKVDPELDVPGWCEFSLDISIDGPETNDFSFDMKLIQQGQASGSSWPVAASYLGPVPAGKSWADRGISASVGDLIVAEMSFNIHDKSREAVERNLGWHGAFVLYFSHGVLSIINKSSETTINQIPLLHNDDTDGDIFDIKTVIPFNWSKENSIIHLELATLSWVTVSVVKQDAVGSNVGTKQGVGNVPVNVFSVNRTMGMGVETVVYGKVERRKQVGSINPFEWIDGFSISNTPFPVTETGTWYCDMSGLTGSFYTGQNNWLLDKASYYLGAALAEKRADEGNVNWLPASKAQFMEVTNKLLEDKRDYDPYYESEPRFVGPHSVIGTWHSDYTSAYWSIIVDELWDIFQDAVARKNAGDSIYLTDSSAYYTGVATSISKIINNISKLEATFPPQTYWPRIYNAEIGLLAYYSLWYRFFIDTGYNYCMKLLDNGYYSGNTTLVYHDSSITSMIVYKAQASGKYHAAGNVFDTSKDVFTWLFSDYASIIPNIQVSGKIQIDDFIKHINGGDERTHLGFYNTAYNNNYSNTDYSYIGSTETLNGNIIHYIENIIKFNGTLYRNNIDYINTFFGMYTYGFSDTSARLNCGMQMG